MCSMLMLLLKLKLMCKPKVYSMIVLEKLNKIKCKKEYRKMKIKERNNLILSPYKNS